MSRLPCLRGQIQQHRFLSNSYGNRGRGVDVSGWESQTDLRRSKNHEKLLHYERTVRLKKKITDVSRFAIRQVRSKARRKIDCKSLHMTYSSPARYPSTRNARHLDRIEPVPIRRQTINPLRLTQPFTSITSVSNIPARSSRRFSKINE